MLVLAATGSPDMAALTARLAALPDYARPTRWSLPTRARPG
ncbi:hypothetical protein FLP41_15610 [Paracoccus marcusii]|nr:hypothetical protein [Paracoccus marcusii]QXI64441.1 hypothetical protein CP157_02195 [Paracoccus marcusii]WVJ72007.1 hypothetical protein FLP41_15610 [Paracoccus marcusii]